MVRPCPPAIPEAFSPDLTSSRSVLARRDFITGSLVSFFDTLYSNRLAAKELTRPDRYHLIACPYGRQRPILSYCDSAHTNNNSVFVCSIRCSPRDNGQNGTSCFYTRDSSGRQYIVISSATATSRP